MKFAKLTLATTALMTSVAFAAHTPLHLSSNSHAGQFSGQQTKAIEKIVHDYLVNNPQVLVEAAQSLRQKQMAQQQSQATKAIAANKRPRLSPTCIPFFCRQTARNCS